jgi:hypothetical protein
MVFGGDSIPVCSLARDQNSYTVTGITVFSKAAAQNELINDDLRSLANAPDLHDNVLSI